MSWWGSKIRFVKILTVIGARPQFVKASVVSRAFKKDRSIRERILHTGQHYDTGMSDVFFRELGIPKPYKNLGVGGKGLHGAQTAEMLVGIEAEIQKEKPDWVLTYGDTNSTLAAAVAASKMGVPIAHVEAGLRSFNRAMPEEINRVVTDRISDLLFAPTPTAVKNLKDEGVEGKIIRTGDVMIDAIYFFRDRAISHAHTHDPYFVLTLHRQENTDHPDRLSAILDGLTESQIPIFFPIHPRTRKKIASSGLRLPKTIVPIDPVSYLDMIHLQSHAVAVWTDSGGMQKEAVVLGKHCYTLRDETEWVETVKEGWNHILGADTRKIRTALKTAGREKKRRPFPTRKYYGDGHASERIARAMRFKKAI